MQHTALMSSIAAVYITRFKSSAMVDTAAGTPFFIISMKAAGWPPVADGVIAEKKMSVAEKIIPVPEKAAGALQTESLKINKAECTHSGKEHPHRLRSL